MGALTNKPFAFHSRPWELLCVNSFDFNDALLLSIRLDLRSGLLMRILPRLLPDQPSNWINDRTRFFFDGLTRQRLALPLYSFSKRYLNVSWSKALRLFSNAFSFGHTLFLPLFGRNLSFDLLLLFKHFLAFLGQSILFSTKLHSFSFLPKQPSFHLSLSLKDNTAFFLLNSDFSCEYPLFNSLFFNANKLHNVKIFSFGLTNSPFVFNLGSLSRMNSFFNGLSLPLESFLLFKHFVFINGSLSNSFSPLSQHFFSLFSSFLFKHGISSTSLLLFENISSVGQTFLNFFPKTSSSFTSSFLFLNQADLFKLTDPSHFSFILYFGSHGDLAASKANLLLPTSSLVENKSSFAFSLHGVFSRFSYAFPPPLDSRSSFSFFSFFTRFLTFSELNKLLPERFSFRSLFPLSSFFSLHSLKVFPHSPFPYRTIFDFFNVDAVTRSSPTLALSRSRFSSFYTSRNLFR
eukprot:TRINITY_DN448_c0_g2_i3.p1 TRINITY_DN448_c0_g2~~TRINITY_DN448_c0_g2_i3.p1  ORF type:complete len:462 (+),score=-14.15 TRINITY_DN448_c0_g2_i3:3634-5019(+)